MANRRRQQGLRLTPLGYLVTGILILVVLIGVYFAIWSARDKKGEAVQQGDPVVSTSGTPSITSTPSLAPITTPTQSPVASESPAPLSSSPSSAVASASPTSGSATATPASAVKTPTSAQKKAAVDGELTTDGVVLREGGSRSFDVIKTYNSGTKLKVYEAEGDYYYVQIVEEKIYGYMASKFITKDGLLSGETASPTPKAPEGTINGTVSASVVALRKMPTTEGNTPIGEAERGDAVFIYFKVDGFYYIQVVKSGLKCYAKADFIQAAESVPTGTAVP